MTESTTSLPSDPEPKCKRLADFTTDEGNQLWLEVNDDVMGGQSLGGKSFTDSTMLFTGEINTDGGGFASLRLPLEPNTLASADHIVFRARSDGRSYDVTFRDNVEGRDRRVTHRQTLPFTTPKEWEEVSVTFADLHSTMFGRRVEAEPFHKDLADSVGLMISDGIDGAFQLEIDWIDLC